MLPDVNNQDDAKFLDQTLYSVLGHVNHVDHSLLAGHMTCFVAPAPATLPGTVRILPPGVTNCPAGLWRHVAQNVSQITAMPINAQMPEDYGFEADFCIRCTKAVDGATFHPYAMPWFMAWLAGSSLIPTEIRDKTQKIARAEADGYGTVVYRGESEVFPMVRSGLSRRYGTKSASALRELSKHRTQALRAKGRGRRLTDELSDLDIAVAHQHLGGNTNLIDFSWSPWVALYFACRDALAETGQMFYLDTAKCGAGVKVHSTFERGYPLAAERLSNQLGVLVEPDSGVLPRRLARTLITVEPHEKPLFLVVLAKVSITHDSLFDDLAGRAEGLREETPSLAWMYLMAERLAEGDFEGVWKESNPRAQAEAGFERDSGLYYRGVASAFLGRLEEAKADLEALVAHREELSPKGIVKRNLRIIERALELGRADRVRGKLNTEIDPDIVTIGFRGSYSLSEGSNLIGGVRQVQSPVRVVLGP